MKHILIILVICFGSYSSIAQFSFNGVVAHRAGDYNDPQKPENSIAALKEAMRIGCYAAEMDVHLTKDHVPVVIHDHVFKGVNIETTNYKDLAGIKLSNGEFIPTLDQYIKATLQHPSIKLWIDLKRSKINAARDVLLSEYVADVIIANHAERRMEIITPSFDALIKLKMRIPVLKLYYIGTDKSPETLRYLDIDGVNLHYARYDKGEYDLAKAKEEGLLIGSYVVDDPAEMVRQLDQGVHFITTNKPTVLIEVLRNYNKKTK